MNSKKCDSNCFYDNISGQYDNIFELKEELASAGTFIAKLQKRYKLERALDIGCGTGRFALAMAQKGINSYGFDPSSLMIEKAEENASKLNLKVDFFQGDTNNMVCNLTVLRFDLILCMGNTIAHLLDREDLFSMLIGCKRLLKPGGKLILNLLNYDRILNQKERIVGITRQDDKEFIRFYDFKKSFLKFNLLEINWEDKSPKHQIFSTKLYPYTHSEVLSALAEADFRECKLYDGIELNEFNLEKSSSLLIEATRK